MPVCFQQPSLALLFSNADFHLLCLNLFGGCLLWDFNALSLMLPAMRFFFRCTFHSSLANSSFLCSCHFWKWTLQKYYKFCCSCQDIKHEHDVVSVNGYSSMATVNCTAQAVEGCTPFAGLGLKGFAKQSLMIPKNPSSAPLLRLCLLCLHRGCTHLPLLCAFCTSVLPPCVSAAVDVLVKQLTVSPYTCLFLYTPRNFI